MEQGQFVTAANFMRGVLRKAGTLDLPPVLDPLARAHEAILFDWNWPSALTMYQLLRALNGYEEEFFDEEEDVFANEDLAIAGALIRSKRDGRYANGEWQWVLETVEGYLGQLD